MNSSRLRQLGGNVFWLVANRIVRMLISVVVLGAVGRHLGVEQFGQLNYAIGLTAVFAAVAGLGFEGIVIRELVHDPDGTGRILCSACLLRLIGGVVAILMVLAVSLAVGDETPQIILALIVALGFLPGSLEVIELWFQKNIQAKATVMVRIASAVVAGILRLILVWLDAPVLAFAFMQVVEAVLAGLALVWVYRTREQFLAVWRPDRNVAGKLLRDSWPLILSGLLVACYFRVEQLLVKQVLGDYSVGIYYASVRMVEIWGFIPVVLLATIYPVLVEKYRGTAAAGRQNHIQIVYDLMTWLGLAIAVAVTLFAKPLITLVFGRDYAPAAQVMMVHAWMAPVNFSGSVRAQYLLLENATIYHTVVACIGIAINIPLTLGLMKVHGTIGAAWAVLLTTWFTGLGTSFIFPRLRQCGMAQLRAFAAPVRWREIVARLRGNQ